MSRSRSPRGPHVAAPSDPARRVCYTCDGEFPPSSFLTDRKDVCASCRATLAYQEVSVLRHFTKWCSACEAYEPLTAFWNTRNGVSSKCGKHQAEVKRQRRAEDATYDGFRKRWFADLKRRVACTQCGSTRDLCFTHLRPADKAFPIAGATGTRTIDEIKAELRKCEVWCRECMTEITGSTLYQQGRSRSTPLVAWDAVFAAVDASVTPLKAHASHDDAASTP